MEQLGLAEKFYESARTELINRIGLRDNVLVLYLAAIGTLFSLALSTKITSGVLLSLPILTLGAAVIITQHNSIIGALASYCATELQSYLDENLQRNCPHNGKIQLHCRAITKVPQDSGLGGILFYCSFLHLLL